MIGGRTFGRTYGHTYGGYNWWSGSGSMPPTGDATPVIISRGTIASLIRGLRVVAMLLLGASLLA